MSKFIAITGAPNSGKTTTAIQLSNQLEKDGCSVFLVFCDPEHPTKEYLFKDNADSSLGKLLSAVEVSEKMILQATTLISENLGVIGYNKGEKTSDYPIATDQGIAQFLDGIEPLADYIVLDIQSKNEAMYKHIKERGASIIAVVKSDIKNAAWAKRNVGFWADIAVLNDYKKGQVLDMEFSNPLIILPHIKKLETNFETLNAFSEVKEKVYGKGISKIKKRVL